MPRRLALSVASRSPVTCGARRDSRDRPDAARPVRRDRVRKESEYGGAHRSEDGPLPWPGPPLPHAGWALSHPRGRGRHRPLRGRARRRSARRRARGRRDDRPLLAHRGRRLLDRADVVHTLARRARAIRARLAGGRRLGLRMTLDQPQHTILVVEDETSIASFVAAYLRNAGYGVRTASTAQAAVVELNSEAPALVVLDLNLPDGDGVELCRCIRKSSDIPILMLTARDEDVDKIIGLEEIRLAPKEFELLWELLDHRGIVLTRDQLLERVWGYTFAGDTRTVDVHVRQIRRKLGDASPIVTVWGVGYKVATDRTPASAV